MMRQTIIIVSRLIEYDLKNEIYDQYQRLSLSFYKRNNTGDLMNRISEDVSKVRTYLGPGLMYPINYLPFTVTLIFMIDKSVELTLWTSSATDNVSIDLLGKQHNEQEKRTGATSTIKANHFRTRNFFRYP